MIYLNDFYRQEHQDNEEILRGLLSRWRTEWDERHYLLQDAALAQIVMDPGLILTQPAYLRKFLQTQVFI
jgi:hypothetical protein